MENFQLNTEMTAKALEGLLAQTKGKGVSTTKKIDVDAKDKEFYDECPHCSTSFYFQFDDVVFSSNETDLESTSDGEEYVQILTTIVKGSLLGNSPVQKSVICPRCNHGFMPAMQTKDEFHKLRGGIGGMSIGLR